MPGTTLVKFTGVVHPATGEAPERVEVPHGLGARVVSFEIRRSSVHHRGRKTEDWYWTAWVAAPEVRMT